MSFLQERVMEYVTSDPRLFVAEERCLFFGSGDKEYWWVDLLIADPWDKKFYLGEMTYNTRPRPLLKKLETFYECVDELPKRFGRDGQNASDPVPEGWSIEPWLFLRKEGVNWLKHRLPNGVSPRITPLEATAFPWLYETIRATGEEPDWPNEAFIEACMK